MEIIPVANGILAMDSLRQNIIPGMFMPKAGTIRLPLIFMGRTAAAVIP